MVLATKVDSAGDVFLNPGDFHFHCPVPNRVQPVRLRTLLGSCVSIVMWHPERRIGAMCHIILPGRSKFDESVSLDGRYADEVMALLHREVIRTGTMPPQYQVYLVGGANMYTTSDAENSVGARNIKAARSQLEKFRFSVRGEHVGANLHRKVGLDLASGLVTVTCSGRQIDLSAIQGRGR